MYPQATTDPSDLNARLKYQPAAMAVMFDRLDGTVTCPDWLSPQATSVPSERRATQKEVPAEMAVKVPVLGTLRVLADASQHGFADLAVAFAHVRKTNFRASNQLLQQLLDDATRPRGP